jgi:hypothetical protein
MIMEGHYDLSVAIALRSMSFAALNRRSPAVWIHQGAAAVEFPAAAHAQTC